jgi:putative hydrolase
MDVRDRTNDDIANRLDEIAALLDAQSANPYRTRAYRRAAAVVRRLAVPASQILDTHGTAGLERLRGIGPRLSRTIRDIVVHGYSPVLERLRGEADPVRLFASVPGIGYMLAARLHEELGLETLPQLEAAAHDGRLEDIAGFGPKRLAAIRSTLALRLGHHLADARHAPEPTPGVDELLDVDREYLSKSAAGALPRIAPRRFNRAGAAWLPIMHTERSGRHYTALFSNTARAHRLGKTNDWVVLYCDDGTREQSWTVVTAAFGPLRGKRIVRGRESECAGFYSQPAADAGPPPADPGSSPQGVIESRSSTCDTPGAAHAARSAS